MKVAQINKQQKFSFKALYTEDFNTKYNNIRKILQNETHNFLSSKNNVYKIGEGIGGETFQFKNSSLNNLVIKTTKKEYNDDYENEYNNLKAIPTEKIGGQEVVARFYNSSNGKYYLVSTLVPGKTASLINKYSDSHFKSLFNKMFELDKLGIYHGDLNGKNILLNNSGSVNFIDYQWTQFVSKTNFYDKEKVEKMLLPRSVFPENAQMFEMASLPYYLEALGSHSDKINFMKQYLRAKSAYHGNRAQHIAKMVPNWYTSQKYLIKQSLAEETAKAKIYREPNNDVLKLEAKKIQFLSDYRDAYSHVDANMPSRNIVASSSAYLCAISAVQDFRKSIQKQLSLCFDSNKKLYLASLLEYGNYWYNNLKHYTSDTFDYVMRAIENKPNIEETRHKFYINDRNPRKIRANRDILKDMDSSFRTSFDANFDVPYGISGTIDNIYSSAIKKLSNTLQYDSKSVHQIDKVKNISKKSKDLNDEHRYLDLLNTAQIATLKIREFRGYINHNTRSYSALSTLNNLLEESIDFTETLFKRIFNGMKYESPSNILVKGYSGMRNFKTKL